MWFAQDAAAPERGRDAEQESRSSGHDVSVRDGASALEIRAVAGGRRYGRRAR
jgi:hypothetical protein